VIEIGVGLGVLTAIVSGVGYLLWVMVNALLDYGSLVGDRIATASTMVMQIDSFLAAGYIISFFQFQSDMSKRIQEAKALKTALGASLKDEDVPTPLRRKGGGEFAYFATRKFSIMMLWLVFFVVSGVYSVGGVLFQTRFFLAESLAFLVWGTLGMLFFWYVIIDSSESIANFIGKYGSKAG
jgi:hypothetical protein